MKPTRKPTRVRTRPLVLSRQTIRLLNDSDLIPVAGGGNGVKKSQAGETCGDCAA